MPRITVTVSDALNEWLNEQSGDSGEFDSKAEVVRESIDVHQTLTDGDADVDDLLEAEDRVEELERELEITQNRLNEAQEQMKHRDEVEEKVDLLAKRVEEQEDAAREPFFVRWVKWWRSSSDGVEA